MKLPELDQEERKVLIVDDDKIVSLLHKQALKRNNITQQPVLCSNGKEALDYLRAKQKEKRTFLVFLDLNMPGMNGWEFLERTQNMTFLGQLMVIIVSSSIYKADYIRAKQYKQVIAFYRKPLCTKDLHELKKMLLC